MTAFTFKSQKIEYVQKTKNNINKIRLIISLFWFVLFIVFVEMDLEIYAFVAVLIFYLLFETKILKSVNYKILVIFVLIFIDFNLMSKFNFAFLQKNSAEQVYWHSLLLSQIFGNVPSSVLISNYTDNWLALVLGANVGSQGIIWASMANIIGVELAKDKKLFFKYHLLSIPFLILTSVLVWVIYFCIRLS